VRLFAIVSEEHQPRPFIGFVKISDGGFVLLAGPLYFRVRGRHNLSKPRVFLSTRAIPWGQT